MIRLLSICLVLFTAALLTACNAAVLFSNDHEEEMDRLQAEVAQCDARQSQYNEELQRQQEQLAAQGRNLEKISASQVVVLEAVLYPTDYSKDVPADPLCSSEKAAAAKLIVGRHEQVWLEDIQMALPARVDTGAETASLDARNIEMFERNGKRWVRFEILHPETGEPLLLERRLERTASIVQSNTSEAERRPVIKLGITIGHIAQSAEFTLSDRSHLDYQLLVGRNILKDVMIVDVSRINVAPPVVDEK